ncbi:hypothetical protein CSHISOI_04943 [Colletotrichum shisoi]|uniref:Uncharacterized protein n=1 Tax=Colletotrichum shisoi TaxID=2078593 RepID=A0A5Q4BTW7_9PEZI|nr:hypothetical protein CSHISOI_04943 [Colletotrichum shisoi]
MKLPSVLLIVTLALTSAEACASYKYCWCLRNDIEYQGKIQSNIAWDDDTTKACQANGGGGVIGYFGQNFKECYRYVKRTWRLDGAIDNCDWNKLCIAVGSAAGVSAYGVCRDKNTGFH